jgi:hypothetical protein
MLAYDYRQKMNEIMKESLGLQGERLGNSYPTKRGSWESLLDRFGQHFPLYLVRTCRKQQAKLGGNAAKHTQNVKKNYVFTQLFLHKI